MKQFGDSGLCVHGADLRVYRERSSRKFAESKKGSVMIESKLSRGGAASSRFYFAGFGAGLSRYVTLFAAMTSPLRLRAVGWRRVVFLADLVFGTGLYRSSR